MSLLFIEHTETPAHNLQSPFDCLYDKYGPALYGFISRTVNVDKDMAGKMLEKVFLAWHLQKDTGPTSFIQLIQITTGIMSKEGYLPCLPLLRDSHPEHEQLG